MGSRFRGRHRAAAKRCKDGDHDFATPASVGGGIVRSVCTVCGEVSIDIRTAEEPKAPGGLFIDLTIGRHLGRRRADTPH
jgi:hypothetical protein